MTKKMKTLADIEQSPLTLDAMWSVKWSDLVVDPAWTKKTFEPAFTVPGGAIVSLLDGLQEE